MTLTDIPDYEVIRQLGKHGATEVVLARHTALDRDVAIKLIDLPETVDTGALDRFKQHLRTLGALQHPNIVPILDADHWPGCCYIVMAYLDGGTLARRITNGLQASQALRIIFQLVQGLSAAHQRGLAHGSLRPHNILFDSDDIAVITDFGTADLMMDLFGEQRTASPYTAPEQIDSVELADVRGDIYALGVLFHEMLTGRRPFPDSPPDRRQAQDTTGAIAPLPAHAARFQPIIARMLALDPAMRYPSARSVLTDLARSVQNLDAPPAAPVIDTQPPPEPAPAPIAHRRTPSSIQWMVMGLALLALPATAWWMEHPQTDPTTASVQAPGPEPTPQPGPTHIAAVPDGTPPQPEPITEPLAAENAPAPLPAATEADPTVAHASTASPPAAGDAEPVTLTMATPSDAPPEAPPALEPYSTVDVELLDGRIAATLVYLPGGTYLMGSPADEQGRWRDEKQHEVTVEPFFIGRHEVTVAEFTRFAAITGYQTEGERKTNGCWSWGNSAEGGTWTWRSKRNWREPGFQQSDDRPVVCVSWNDAMAYVDWLNQQTGGGFRLPTEAEWEYAARGGTLTSRFWGDDAAEACNHANVADRTIDAPGPRWAANHRCEDGQWFTAPVDAYGGHPWNLADMLGNVWEWTCSNWDESFKGDYSTCAEPGTRGWRALRGGAWDSDARSARAAARFRNRPDYRLDTVGFRIARSRPSDTVDTPTAQEAASNSP